MQPNLSDAGPMKVGCLMIAKLNCLPGGEPTNIRANKDRAPMNYVNVCKEGDPFPDSSLLDPLDITKNDETEVESQKMIDLATDIGLTNKERRKLSHLVQKFNIIFLIYFASAAPAVVKKKYIELVPDAKSVLV